MKLLVCTSIDEYDGGGGVDEDNNPGKETNSNKTKKPTSQILIWFNQLRKLFTGNSIRARSDTKVEISKPVLLSPDDTDHVTGIVKVRPQLDENFDEGSDQIEEIVEEEPILGENSNQESKNQVTSKHKINSETNTEPLGVEQSYENVLELAQNNDLKNLKSKNEENILNQGWFWGDISRKDAESLLRGQEEGTFLVRRSSDRRYLYSLSFRSNGKTLHTRIEYCNGLYYFYSNDSSPKQEIDGSSSLIDLISDAMNQNNADNIFFYSRGLKNETSLHTITLVKPLSRFSYVINYNFNDKNLQQSSSSSSSLQYLCKFIIHHSPIAQAILKSQQHLLSKKLDSFLNDILLFPCASKKIN